MLVKNFMGTQGGAILASVILGLGLAALFRSACTGSGCVVIRGPNPNEMINQVYRVQEECWRYSPQVVQCPASGSIVVQASDR
jgi:hypothetical protein